MRCVVLAFLCVGVMAIQGCSTLEPTEASPEEIQRLILSEEILTPGQRVRLVTEDASVHEFRVTSVDTDARTLLGEEEAVPIDSIVAVETRKISAGRTALLTGGLAYGVGIIIAIAIAPAMLLGGL